MDSLTYSVPEASASPGSSQYQAAANLNKTFPQDWYIRVKASFHETTSTKITIQIQELGQKVTALHDRLKIQLEPQDIQLLSQRFVTESDARTEKVYICYWLIGLPTMPSVEIAKARMIARPWEVEVADILGGNEKVQTKFVKREVILKQDLKPDVLAEERRTAATKETPKEDTKRSGALFKKIKGSNPAQVRKQFLQHVMGGQASSSEYGRDKSSGGKLRPAKEVLSRLKYDGEYNLDEYLVGYMDRKAGILEKSVAEWEKYEESELIAYFKHAPENEIVWDRARKIDWISNARPD